MTNRCCNCFNELGRWEQVCSHCGFQMDTLENNPQVLAAGTILKNRFQIGRTLGRGGFGITYLAWDMNAQIRVAIKEYYPGNMVMRDVTAYGGNTLHTMTSADRQNFKTGLEKYVQEATILSRYAKLPGIVSVKEFFYENGTAYIVMEYVDGISLKDFVEQKGGKLSTTETLQLMRPVIHSLSVIHRDKLLHRDISPDNIMIDKSGIVKLIDFGAARYFESGDEKSMTVMLKHGYAPVEQYSKKGEQGSWTDIYALCAVMYRLLTGVVPEESVSRTSHDQLISIQRLAPSVPKQVAKVIEKGLAVDAKKRYQSMNVLYDELYAPKEIQATEKGNKLLLIIAIAVACLAIATGLLLLMGSASKANNSKDNGYVMQRMFRYHADGSLEWTEEPEYDKKGNEIRRVIYYADGSIGGWGESENDEEGNEIRRTIYNADNSLNCIYESKWDEEGNLIQKIRYLTDGSIDYTYQYQYNNKDDVTKWTYYNGAGDVENMNDYQLEYDWTGNLSKSVVYDIEGNQEFSYTFEYDKKGNEIKSTLYNGDDSIGYWNESEWDTNGNKIKNTYYNADGSVSYWEEYEYIFWGDGS
ncbi:MAG: protein kinase [Lachnospiraceae bacterium]|nr:protein kinase [Lachnospiraceae bacterium]